MNCNVLPAVGFYRVFESNRDSVREFIVGRDGRCSCGGRYLESARCEHITAIIEHLESGGARAAIAEEQLPKPQPPIPLKCPICGGETRPQRVHRAREIYWECMRDASHFWMDRGEPGVRAFLTQPHPNKIGGFYEREEQAGVV